MRNGTDALTPMQDRKTAGGFASSVLLIEGGAEIFELSKA